MDLWNSRYLNRTTKNNVPVYPKGTGATIEGTNLIKLNQYLAPQKSRYINQYVPMDSVDPLRFRTQEQEIARKELDGSERILYPYRSNSLIDIFPPDPYRINLTGNPSKFGGMTHPIAHRNTGAIDLEDTDFINWKEGIDMTLEPGAEGASAYLSRALHAPPRDGLDINAARLIDPAFADAIQYYEDKKPRYKNKRQLQYRDPITGVRRYVNLPEYPNSVESLAMMEESNNARNRSLASRSSIEPTLGGDTIMKRPDIEATLPRNMDMSEGGMDMSEGGMEGAPYKGEPMLPSEIDDVIYNGVDTFTDEDIENVFNTYVDMGDNGTNYLWEQLVNFHVELRNMNLGLNDQTILDEAIKSTLIPKFEEGIERATTSYQEYLEANSNLKQNTIEQLTNNYRELIIRWCTNQLYDEQSSLERYANSQTVISKEQITNNKASSVFPNTQSDYDKDMVNTRTNNTDLNSYKEGEALNNTNDHNLYGWGNDPSPEIKAQDVRDNLEEKEEKGYSLNDIAAAQRKGRFRESVQSTRGTSRVSTNSYQEILNESQPKGTESEYKIKKKILGPSNFTPTKQFVAPKSPGSGLKRSSTETVDLYAEPASQSSTINSNDLNTQLKRTPSPQKLRNEVEAVREERGRYSRLAKRKTKY